MDFLIETMQKEIAQTSNCDHCYIFKMQGHVLICNTETYFNVKTSIPAIKDAVESKQYLIANDVRKETEVILEFKSILKLKTITNLMMIPVLNYRKQVKGAILLCNQFSTIAQDSKGKEKFYVPFVPTQVAATSVAFLSFLSCSLKQALNEEKILMKIQEPERNCQFVIDQIMSECSVKAFVKTIEKLLPKLFNCERATVVLVHRMKNFMFRLTKDAEGVDTYKRFQMGRGYSGIVAVSGKSLYTGYVGKDVNFCEEIDDATYDPKNKQHSRADEIFSFPLYTREEKKNFGNQEAFMDLPYAVVHLVNKCQHNFQE